MNPLIAVLQRPAVIEGWDAATWNRFLPLARSARLLVRCLALFERHCLLDRVPSNIADQLRGARVQARYVQGQALRELRRVNAVLRVEQIPLMVLKGVAYLYAGLPPSGWRGLSDIDLLVRAQDLGRAEQALLAAGWEPNGEFDDYDQRYYREWMHEIPPLGHPAREMEVDLHHNLAPPVSRIRIDATELWRRAREVDDDFGNRILVPAPEDLLVHNAVHLFMNDELRGGLRDVVDFRDLYVHFSARADDFDRRLLERAQQFGCGRPLHYALATAGRLVGLQPSADLVAAARRHAPSGPVDQVMRILIDRLMAPERPNQPGGAVAERLLFVRSHWVRMPPLMLARHLLRKATRRGGPVARIEDTPG